MLSARNTEHDILSKMKVDSISMCVKTDKLILKFGNLLCHKLRKEDQQHISNKLRELSRMVL